MTEDQEQLFEKILVLALKNKLVLWAGAGLSMEAGYPSGSQLAELLWRRLPEDEKLGLSKDLLMVSDFYVHRNDKGRDELIMLLKEIFKKKDQKSESHDTIRKMEFFNIIITTNYDELFEDHITDIEIIKSAKELARSKSNSRKLIKIHGDLNSPKKLVLTKDDYSKLYNINQQNPFWGKINVELTEKGVLFIGYGFNDPNVRGLFDFLHKKLKKHKKPKYLIAPGLSESEKAMLKHYEIHYLDTTGKDFLNRLYQEWKNNGFKYFGSNELNTDDLINSLKHEGIPVAVSSKPEGGRLLHYNPAPDKVWDLTFKSNNKKIDKRISEWKKGYGSDDLIIPKEFLSEAILKIGDFVIGNQLTLPEFRFFRQGRTHEKVRIVFAQSKVELENLKVRTYKYGDNGLKIIVEDQYASFTIIIPEFNTSNFTYTGTIKPNDICESVSGVLKWFEAINALGKGETFKVFSKGLPNGVQDSNGGHFKNDENFQRIRLVFQVLRNIEEKFNVRFIDIKEKEIFCDNTLKRLNEFFHLFQENRFHPKYSQGLPVKSISDDPEKEVIPLIDQVARGGYLIFLSEQNNVMVLNQEIKLGKGQLFIENPILERTHSEPDQMIVKSSSNNYFVFYEAFGLATFK